MSSIETLWKEILSLETENPWPLLENVKEAVLTSTEPAVVNFGTSGWRGELGVEFTLRNVQVVAEALLDLYRKGSPEVLEALGVSGFEQLKKEGLLIGHDNRLMGPEFAKVVANVFEEAGVKVLYGGEATTPEFSAGVEMFSTACAVNLTPSHNPANYSGIKFNPKDGGPAGEEITVPLTNFANERMKTHEYKDQGEPNWTEVNVSEGFERFVENRKTIDLKAVRDFANSGKLTIVSDSVHGATRGLPNYLLQNTPNLKTLRTDDNYLFGRIAPEPSSKNMAQVKSDIDAAETPFKLGVIFDPDGDRIRYYDGEIEIDMNKFGAMAFHYMAVHQKRQGVLAKSVATSNFANAIAKGLGIEVAETAVGFKNFRPLLKQGASPMALIAFEESDGISGFNNTIEKDAQFGLLLSIEMMAKTGKTLGQYLEELQEEYGYFFPERAGFEVDKSMTGAPLVTKVNAIVEKVNVGSRLKIGGVEKIVSEIITLDGVKVIFDDESWMLIRPSGTEPKVRIYTECRIESEKEAMFKAAQDLFYA